MSWNEGYKDLGIASQVLHHSATFFLLQPMIPFVLFFAIGEEFQRFESYYLQGLKTIRFLCVWKVDFEMYLCSCNLQTAQWIYHFSMVD